MSEVNRKRRSRRGAGSHTGAIWAEDEATRVRVVEGVCRTLHQTYGLPRLGNPTDPLDDLIYIILSNKTPQDRAERVFRGLKRQYPRWEAVLEGDPVSFERAIYPAGLVGAKARQILAALSKIRADFGACDLSSLSGWSYREVHDYLVSLPGVSDKVAKCVMLYTLGAEVLPVDSHVHRVARRLGWTDRNEPRQAHAELEELVPPALRFGFHVGSIVHGRKICRPARPNCRQCPIKHWCHFYQNQVNSEEV